MAQAMLGMATAGRMIHATVPISRFNTGEAGKIIGEAKADGIRIIVRNNAPECILRSMGEYGHLMPPAQVPVTVQAVKYDAHFKHVQACYPELRLYEESA